MDTFGLNNFAKIYFAGLCVIVIAVLGLGVWSIRYYINKNRLKSVAQIVLRF